MPSLSCAASQGGRRHQSTPTGHSHSTTGIYCDPPPPPGPRPEDLVPPIPRLIPIPPLGSRASAMAKDGGFAKVLLLHVAALSTAGAVAAAAALARRRLRGGDRRRKQLPQAPAMAEMPRLRVAESGRLEYLEKFSHYVARQLGFQDVNECPQLCKLANNYLNNSKTCMEDIYGFFANAKDAECLYVKLIEELDRCILGYFAFHWDHATYLISSALTADSGTKKKWRNMVLEATSIF